MKNQHSRGPVILIISSVQYDGSSDQGDSRNRHNRTLKATAVELMAEQTGFSEEEIENAILRPATFGRVDLIWHKKRCLSEGCYELYELANEYTEGPERKAAIRMIAFGIYLGDVELERRASQKTGTAYLKTYFSSRDVNFHTFKTLHAAEQAKFMKLLRGEH